MARYKLIDGKSIQFTEEEEKIRDAEEKKLNDDKPNIDIRELRIQRNFLLSETDYMALSDVTMSDAWKKYRQDLRDITKTFKSMNDKDFKFPTKPTE